MNLRSLFQSEIEGANRSKLYAYRDNDALIQRLNLNRRLSVHTGCVNTLCWSDIDSTRLLSGSDDQHLTISDAFSGAKKLNFRTGHRTNIFTAKFLPKTGDLKIVSGSAGGDIYLNDLEATYCQRNVCQSHYACHGDKTVYEIRTLPQDPYTFTSCGQDGAIKWFDIRQSASCDKAHCKEHTLVKLSTGITALAVNPHVPYHLVCGGLDGIVRLYDRRMLSVGVGDEIDRENKSSLINQSSNGLFAYFGIENITSAPKNIGESEGGAAAAAASAAAPSSTVVSNKRITSIQYDTCGQHLLVSYQSDYLYLLDWRDLSLDNKNDVTELQKIFGVDSDGAAAASCSSEQQPEEQQATPSSSTQSSPATTRRFRIQTDWSDTGPLSMPVNEMESANDPRSNMMRRLNDWFRELCTTPRSTTSNESTAAAAATAVTPDSSSTLSGVDVPSPQTTSQGAESAAANATSNEDAVMEDENSTSDEPESESAARRRREALISYRRANLVSITNSIFGSRIRSKQQMKIENTIIKNKPFPKIKMIYSGHRNVRTMIKEANFWGNDYIMSGSDCGHIFFWDKNTGKIVNILEADKHVVNCIQENPSFPVLASSGIDHDVKIWEPTLEMAADNASKIDMIIKRNKLMLEESRNTIFIPVQFMVPALRLFSSENRR